MRNGPAATERLGAHLQARYGIAVDGLTELDAGVFQVSRHGGPSWVARVFPAARSLDGIAADARILRRLERAGFPAERCAHPDAVSTHEGQAILVTEFVEGARPEWTGRTFAILGALLGRLHARSGVNSREGGAWHQLSLEGGPREEIAAAAALLADALPRIGVRELPLYDRLRDEVERTDDCRDLPHAFVHPDFVPVNAITTPDGRLVIVDWAGAGRGPRLWSLGFVLWAAGATSPKLVDVVVSRYSRHVRLEADELARLANAIRGRPLMIECWSFGMGRRPLRDVVERVLEAGDLAEAIAARARQAFDDQPRG